jgi:hypothetical protein
MALRAILLGVLAASLSYCLVIVFSLMTQSNNCLGPWRPTPSCRTTLSHLTVPSRHEVIVALLCGIAAVEACALNFPASAKTALHVAGRHVQMVESTAITAVLLIVSVILDPALHTVPAVGAVGLLVWATWRVARGIAAAFAELDIGHDRDLREVPPSNPVAGRILIGVPLAFAAAAIAARFASAQDMPHVSSKAAEVSAAVYVLAVITLLVHLHYVSFRHEWREKHAVVFEGLRVRWVKSWAVLLAGFMLVAVISPGAVTQATNATGSLSSQIWMTVVGLASHAGTSNPTSVHCESQPQYCKRRVVRPDDTIGVGRQKPGRQPGRRQHTIAHPSDWLAGVTRLAVWLTPIPVLVVLFWSSHRRRAAGNRGIVAMLHALWRRVCRRSWSILATLQDRLPVALADPNRSFGAARVRRLAGGGDLSAREQVLRYYLNIVSYAGQREILRGRAQTPEEFEYSVAERLLTGIDAWKALTDDFVEARYSSHPMQNEQVMRVRRNWRISRGAIRETTKARSSNS